MTTIQRAKEGLPEQGDALLPHSRDSTSPIGATHLLQSVPPAIGATHLLPVWLAKGEAPNGLLGGLMTTIQRAKEGLPEQGDALLPHSRNSTSPIGATHLLRSVPPAIGATHLLPVWLAKGEAPNGLLGGLMTTIQRAKEGLPEQGDALLPHSRNSTSPIGATHLLQSVPPTFCGFG